MRALFISLFFVCLCSFNNVKAQLSYSLVDTAYVNLAIGGKGDAGIEVFSNANLIFEWRVLDYFIPNNWICHGICDWGGCYPLLDTAWHKTASTSNIPLNRLFYETYRNLTSGDGCAIVKVEYREQGQTNSAITNLIVTSYSNTTSCWPLSTHQPVGASRVQIYPNPTLDKVQFFFPTNEIYSVQVYDIYGRWVTQVENHGNNLTLSMFTYPNGFYIAYFKGSDGRTVGAAKFRKK